MPVVRAEQRVDAAPIPGARRQAAETEASAGVGLADQQAHTALAGAGLGATIEGAGTLLLKNQREIVDKEKERADQIAVMNAGNVLSEWENQRLYDPNTGAMGKHGRDAFGLPESVGDEFQTVASQVETSLSTDRQREAFTRLKLERQQNIDHTLRTHVFGEMQRYEAQELDATVENARSEAITNADNPRRVGLALGRAVDAIRTHAPRLGLGPEEIKQKVDATTSATHVGVIENLLAQDKTKSASVYFDETKSQIKGESLARIEKALEEGKNRGEAQKSSDTIIAAGGSLSQQLEKARAIDDPKLRDEVTARIEHNDTVKERATREQEAQTLRGVYDIIDRTHDTSRIPATVWANMDGGQRASARSYAEHLARGVAVETDFPTYYALMQKAAHDPEKFATENLLTYRAKIGDSELKQLAEMQGAIVKGDRAAAEKQLGGFRTHEAIVDDSLVRYGIDPKEAGKNSKTGGAIAELRGMLDSRVQAQENLTGKKPTNDDVQKILDQILSTKTGVTGSWWNIWPGSGAFFSTEKRLIDLQIGDVPEADKQQITDALKRANRPVSPATILDLYLERKARGLK